MEEEIHLAKIEVLIQQERYKEAEKILMDLLGMEPNQVQYLYLLAELNLLQDKFENAENLVNNAIGLSPDVAILHFLKSRIAMAQEHMKEAEDSVSQAIALDPLKADFFALQSNIKLAYKQFDQALESANKALQLDAENLMALNARSTALTKLNKSDLAFETIEGALRNDPNNSYTHANYGWGLLEKGEHHKALEHFKESLSKDPNFEFAQVGLLEAIKATNPIYRLFLKYAFAMSKLTAKYQWAVIIGFYLIFKLLRIIANNSPTLQPYIFPILILFFIVAFSTWVINPISNLFLRLNKYGALLLDEKEKLSSNFVGISLFISLSGILLYLVLSEEKMLPIAVFGFAMMVPLGSMLSPAKNNYALIIYTAVLAVLGFLAIGITLAGGELVNGFSLLFVIGFVAFQWVANFILIKDDNYQ